MGLPDFKALKERVGIDDVAYYLGYQVNRQAGVGRFIEMVLPDGNGGHSDSIVIREPHDKANQFYFRHKGFGKGDVIAFIQENINRFNETGRNQWEIVGKVLMRLANEPMPEINGDSYLGRVSYPGRQSFEPERWETQPMSDHVRNALQFMAPRGFNLFTAETFAPYIVRIRDTQSESYKEFNIGFPYRVPGNDEVVGYEIRGFGQYKSKATGTNSTTAAWIVDLSSFENPRAVRNVYFAESAYDIMAFYQINHKKLDKERSVFVSIGGTFSDQQIKAVMNHYTKARAVDCFDNDMAGQVYGIRMAALLENKSLHVVRTDEGIHLSVEGKDILLPPGKATLSELGKHVKLSGRVSQWKPPREFKDWNDVIMRRPWEQLETTNKFQRDEALEQRRNKGRKM